MKAWVNGKLIPAKMATVPILSHAFSRGTAAFEVLDVVATTGGLACFRLDAHLDRLFNSVGMLDMQIPFTKEELAKAVMATVKHNAKSNCAVKIFAFWGGVEYGLEPESKKVTVAIFTYDGLGGGTLEDARSPVTAGIAASLKVSPRASNPHTKICGNYGGSYMAEHKVIKDGSDKAILVDEEGFVAEGTLTNVFFVKDGVVYTAGLRNVLPGITRDSVIQLARSMGLKVVEGDITADQAREADEAFFTGSVIRVRPIKSIDGKEMSCPGTLTSQISSKLDEAYLGNAAGFEKWLSLVGESEKSRKPRYDTSRNWYKGNTHIHSTASDGGKTFAEIAELYAGAGYDFLVRADHWVASNVDGKSENGPVVWLDGIELDGRDQTGAGYHVVCLGTFEGLTREAGLERGLALAREQGGLLILAHPHWTRNSFDDALRWDFDGVEVYNHACWWLNGKGDSKPYWSVMLQKNPNTMVFAADDAHLKERNPCWNGAWVMVNCQSRSRESIMAAIRAGNFYSTRGPEIHSIEYAEGTVTVRCSPVKYIRVAGESYWCQRAGSPDGGLVTEATLEVPDDWPYAYLELEDEQGRLCWSNPLYVVE